jgi:gentisate 1,2-dioxygenase
MDNYITAYEYEKNVNPNMGGVPIVQKNIIDCSYGMTFIDFSDVYKVNYKSTSPNLLASFIKIKPNDSLDVDDESNNSFVNATSHLFFVIKGNCEMHLDDEKVNISNGDILVTPLFNKLLINNPYDEELQIYYINDSPLINYLGSRSLKKIFKTALYSRDFLISNLFSLSDPNNNRKGILLSNKDTEKIGTNTISPVLWALYNELPPNTIQRPHKHNSVALDFCINCSDSDNIYTLIGDELDENGNIVNPVKINWKQGEMFITPPGLWHSHNNKGNTFAYILPIQDAGLLLYQRILGIVLN